MSGLIIASVAALTHNLLVAAPAIFKLRGASVDPEEPHPSPRGEPLARGLATYALDGAALRQRGELR